ncbi:hypothetical protein I4F81_003635 [Pyropia yezoensis]|uniref:Uncharacterized protein n=1 Tax=Pyropia yezoensis TaxID=2788 RepID=A0ACC3BUB4_PYRYE|nr:hypothetical protein I4F81_003635 [Neopyropia yezoensis]
MAVAPGGGGGGGGLGEYLLTSLGMGGRGRPSRAGQCFTGEGGAEGDGWGRRGSDEAAAVAVARGATAGGGAAGRGGSGNGHPHGGGVGGMAGGGGGGGGGAGGGGKVAPVSGGVFKSVLAAVAAGRAPLPALLDASYGLTERLPADVKADLVAALTTPALTRQLLLYLTVIVPPPGAGAGGGGGLAAAAAAGAAWLGGGGGGPTGATATVAAGGGRGPPPASHRYPYVVATLLSRGPVRLRRALTDAPARLDDLFTALHAAAATTTTTTTTTVAGGGAGGAPADPLAVHYLTDVALSAVRDAPAAVAAAAARARPPAVADLLALLPAGRTPEVLLNLLCAARATAAVQFGPVTPGAVWLLASGGGGGGGGPDGGGDGDGDAAPAAVDPVAGLLPALGRRIAAAAAVAPPTAASVATVEAGCRVLVGVGLRVLLAPRLPVRRAADGAAAAADGEGRGGGGGGGGVPSWSRSAGRRQRSPSPPRPLPPPPPAGAGPDAAAYNAALDSLDLLRHPAPLLAALDAGLAAFHPAVDGRGGGLAAAAAAADALLTAVVTNRADSSCSSIRLLLAGVSLGALEAGLADRAPALIAVLAAPAPGLPPVPTMWQHVGAPLGAARAAVLRLTTTLLVHGSPAGVGAALAHAGHPAALVALLRRLPFNSLVATAAAGAVAAAYGRAGHGAWRAAAAAADGADLLPTLLRLWADAGAAEATRSATPVTGAGALAAMLGAIGDWVDAAPAGDAGVAALGDAPLARLAAARVGSLAAAAEASAGPLGGPPPPRDGGDGGGLGTGGGGGGGFADPLSAADEASVAAVAALAVTCTGQPTDVAANGKAPHDASPLASSSAAVAMAAMVPGGVPMGVKAGDGPPGGPAGGGGEPLKVAAPPADAAARRRRAKKERKRARKAATAEGQAPDARRYADAADAADGESPPDAGQTPATGAPPKCQTDPPSIPVARFFPSGVFPAGEVQAYRDDRAVRTSAAEERERARIDGDVVNALRHAAEAHRRVRGYMAPHIRPGVKLIDLCERLEGASRSLVGAHGLDAGIAFPTGCSVNHVAAHYTPNSGDDTVLGADDVLKVDVGTHVGGHIIDSAWTVAFHPRFEPLLGAVRAATDAGIVAAGIDVRVGDVGAAIQEVMESHEVELGGVTRPIRCVRNLNGHSVGRYAIHGGVAGVSVPIVRTGSATAKMEEGQCYAIETFGTTGRGYVVEGGECSHYMRRDDVPRRVPLRLARSRSLLATIDREFGKLAFCRRYLDRLGERRYMLGLKGLCDAEVVDPCPPLLETPGSYVAQFEHTILLGPTSKEVLSRGEDY